MASKAFLLNLSIQNLELRHHPKRDVDDITSPLVSVIMNCFNCSEYLKESIESVYAQSYSHWEIIFWDNGSQDSSAEIARSYDARLRYFKSDKTVPLGRARNMALREASGDLIAFLDCDDIWLPDKLKKQVVLFGDARVGIVYSNFVFFSTRGRREINVFKYNRLPSGHVFDELLTRYFLPMLTVVIRRKCLDGLPEWFDDRFQVCEEADLFIRLSHDWDVGCCSDVLARCRIHNQSWTWNKPELFWQEYEIMIKKYEDLYSQEVLANPELLAGLKQSVVYGKAVTALKENRKKEARRLVLPNVFSHPKYAFLFLFSFFSYDCYRNVLRLMGRIPPPL